MIAAPLICPRCGNPPEKHFGYGSMYGYFTVNADSVIMVCRLTEAQAIHAAQRVLGLAELKYLRGQRDAYRFFSPGTADSFHMDAIRVLDVLRLLRVAKSTMPFWGKRK